MEIDAADMEAPDGIKESSLYDGMSWAEIIRLQDEELEESLAMDRETEKRRLRALKIEEENLLRSEEIRQMHREDLYSRLLRLGHAPSVDGVHLAVKCPCGKRSTRNFSGSDAVSLLYDFAATQNPSCVSFVLVDVSRNTALDDLGTSLCNAGLHTRTTLLMVSTD